MATYGVKYELKFSDNRGHKRTLEILKKDYEGDILPIIGTDSPAIIRYENQDDFYNPIIGSSCEINIICIGRKRTSSFMIFCINYIQMWFKIDNKLDEGGGCIYVIFFESQQQ